MQRRPLPAPDRLDTSAKAYKRKPKTTSGEVELTVQRLRMFPFETQIIRRYQTRQSSAEEARSEMYLAGVSVRRVEDIRRRCGALRSAPAGQRAQPEDLRENRIMADMADRGRTSVRVRRRCLPEAQSWRGGAERVRARGRRREFKWIP